MVSSESAKTSTNTAAHEYTRDHCHEQHMHNGTRTLRAVPVNYICANHMHNSDMSEYKAT